jgi:uncharacterized protein (DUF885 family)
MSNFGSPAHNATLGMGAGMLVVAAAGVSLASCINADLDAARERRHEAAYGNALTRATQHAAAMEEVARISIERVAALEAQVRSLTAACAQRQGCIDRMRARMS